MSFAEKYGLIFRASDSEGKIYIDRRFGVGMRFHVYASLNKITLIHLEECEYLIAEIEEAQASRDYVNVPNFDWNGVDIELHYPNVEIDGFIISMDDFKGILMEWIDFNSKFKGN
jgi:hypothetical protein